LNINEGETIGLLSPPAQ